MGGRLAQFALRRVVPLALLAAAVVTVIVAPVFALTMAPAIFILLLLANGFMPGEDLIVRHRLTRTRRPRRPSVVPIPRRVDVIRGTGHQLAFALAMRPPPASPSSVLN